MAKYQWDFSLINKDTAVRDGLLMVRDDRTETIGYFALKCYTGDGEWGDCVYMQSGFREHDAESALSIWGWI